MSDPWWPKCPWPEDVWPMTESEYVKAVPDEKMRTEISGFLMRRGWQIASRDISERMQESQNKETPVA